MKFWDLRIFIYFCIFWYFSSGSRRGVVGEWLSEEKQGKTKEKMVVGESVGESSGSPSGSRRGVVGECQKILKNTKINKKP